MCPAERSAVQSAKMTKLLTPVLQLTEFPAGLWHTLVRKLAHMAEFALLGAFRMAALSVWERDSHLSQGRRSVTALCICLLRALADEAIQLFVPGRSSQVTDMWIDALGAAIGFGAALLFGRKKRRMG